jgi:hypothetical protein
MPFDWEPCPGNTHAVDKRIASYQSACFATFRGQGLYLDLPPLGYHLFRLS